MQIPIALSHILEYIFPPDKQRYMLLHSSPSDLRRILPEANSDVPSFAYSLFDYQSPAVREMIHLVKFSGDPRAVRTCAQLIYEELINTFYEDITQYSSRPLVVPIPLSNTQKRSRGFNQCELLVNQIKTIDTQDVFRISKEVLTKPEDTPSQTEMHSKQARKENVAGCFLVPNTSLVKGEPVIILDDVVTTGATLTEARKELLGAGAESVAAVTLAH